MAKTAGKPGAAAKPAQPPALRPPAVGGVEKAAILLLTLGPEVASGVFRQLKEHEVRQLAAAIARVRLISPQQAAVVHEEVWRRLSNREGILVDGEHFARQLVGNALPAPGDHSPAIGVGQTGGEFLAETLEPISPGILAQVLAAEHPQVAALIVANLKPRQAAGVLGALPEDLQPDIVRRIADLQGVSGDVLAEVGDVLQGQVQGLARAETTSEAGGPKLAAKILNAVDKAVEARVFAHLESEAPDVAETIRAQMLTFEDLAVLDNRGMQVVLKEVAREDLMLALKTASPTMRDKVFGNISARAADILRDDMSTMGPVRLKDVEKAQANIVAVVRRLEAEQKITLGAGGEDVIA